MTQINQMQVDGNARKFELDKTLDDIGWGALFITTGAFWLVPETLVPQGGWMIAVGLILLGLNAIRYIVRIEMNGFGFVLGFLALFAGMGAFFNLTLPLFPIALIVIGACMLLAPEFERRSISSTAHGWRCCQ